MSYILHYAPDNASLIVRLALDSIGAPYETVLVDRARQEQRGAAYRQLNPNGLIPTLETKDGAIFETGAILLWLVDTHRAFGPAHDQPGRGDFLKWLFFCANTLHPHMQMLFYPQKLVGGDTRDQQRVIDGTQRTILQDLDTLEAAAGTVFGTDTPTVIDMYLACLLRWSAVYGPDDRAWFRLAKWPQLAQICARMDALPATVCAQSAEGLGPTPFSAPQRANPPEGSAL
ncbi:glutathione S-transferase family protein [uncultured Tateyamaria sp.]|uniref:glutathione S-transferase family protein n=1 Tax=uncultured Tateyamaria sp. TaxID=455651 RepID=UPI00262382A0|nr:glutathione S-transferase family protein [uncultured Tateyamaria sp.]